MNTYIDQFFQYSILWYYVILLWIMTSEHAGSNANESCSRIYQTWKFPSFDYDDRRNYSIGTTSITFLLLSTHLFWLFIVDINSTARGGNSQSYTQPSRINLILWFLGFYTFASTDEVVDALKLWNSMWRQVVEPLGELQIFPSFSIKLREVTINITILNKLQFGRIPLIKT